MDAPDSGSRHSRPSSAPNSEHPQGSHGYQGFQPMDRVHHDRPAMGTSSILNASGGSYPHQHPSYQSGYPQSGSNLTHSAEVRKPADDSDPSKRQSLPSISEVISGAKPPHYPPPPSSIPQQSSSFPSHFSANPPRSYPEHEKHPGTQPVHSSSAYPPRQEALSLSTSPRPPFSGRPGVPIVTERRLSPSGKPELPHGQLPLPYYPPSPRNGPPHPLTQYDQRSYHEDGERGVRNPYNPDSHNRNFEPWTYQDALSRVREDDAPEDNNRWLTGYLQLGQASRVLYNFAEAYSRLASEQHGAHPIPERLPSEHEVNEMIGHADQVKYALEQLRDMVQQSMRSERAREAPKSKGPYEDEQDVSMYGDGMKQHYGMATEVKKRRGRAAPPGRCHSCNRIDTPEWRRGPDGARTLCNACGLHYAKLERKRQLEARSIRPKPDDRN